MKKGYIGFVLVLSVGVCYGQVTEKLKQIVKLRVYIAQLEKGYNVVERGLKTIGDIKNGHLVLDEGFFSGLKSINPNIRNYSKAADIVTMNYSILGQFNSTIVVVRSSKMYSVDEQVYINNVFKQLTAGCADIIADLNKIIIQGEFEMSDDERIRRIDLLFNGMLDRYSFCRFFSDEVKVLVLNKGRERRGAATLRLLNGN